MLTDIEIAKNAKMIKISEIAKQLGITEDDLIPYGHYMAKVSEDFIARSQKNKDGKLVLVTAINPTPAGEGKTTTTVGIGQALGKLNKKAVIALREPSLGPVFGVKGGADVVLEVAGAPDTFQLAWKCARPNAIVTVVALYDVPQILPLPEMYGKNLTFKTGGVDGCDCAEILALIEAGKIDTTPLITHRYKLEDIAEAYRIFENKLDGVIKIAITPQRS